MSSLTFRNNVSALLYTCTCILCCVILENDVTNTQPITGEIYYVQISRNSTPSHPPPHHLASSVLILKAPCGTIWFWLYPLP